MTLFAALGKMSLLSFSIASTIGKIPALWIEVYSAYHVMNGTNEAKWIVTIAGAIGLFYLWKNGENKEGAYAPSLFLKYFINICPLNP